MTLCMNKNGKGILNIHCSVGYMHHIDLLKNFILNREIESISRKHNTYSFLLHEYHSQNCLKLERHYASLFMHTEL